MSVHAGDVVVVPPRASTLSGWIRRRPAAGYVLLLSPALLFLVVLYAYPLARIFWISVSDPALSLEHYWRFVSVPVYVRVIGVTFKIAVTVTLLCLILGYPTAYLLSAVSSVRRNFLLILVLLPFWTSLLVRTYAWIAILQREGVINKLLRAIGLLDAPVQMVHNTLGVTIGMTHVLLPFMILPLYSVMSGIDKSLVKAGQTLGATGAQAFWHVFVPLSLPGVGAGCLLVFISALGFFVTPAVLGGPRDMLVSQLISMQVNVTLNWGFASAIAFILLTATIAIYTVYDRFFGLDKMWGGASR